MNRSIIAIIVSTLLFAWWAYPESAETKAPMAPVISESTPASGVPHLMAWPNQTDMPSTPHRSPTVDQPIATEEQRNEAALLAPYSRPSRITEFKKRGLGDQTVVPTAEEKIEIINALREKIDQAVAGGHYKHSQWITADLHATKIEAAELGEEHVQKLVGLAQQDIMRLARRVENDLARGCPYDAMQYMDLSMGLLRATLQEQLVPWYQNRYLDDLRQRIDEAYATYYNDSVPNSVQDVVAEDSRHHRGCS